MYGITAATQGRIVSEPVFRFVATGTALLSFRMVVESKPQPNGEKADPEWLSVSVWGDTAQALNATGRCVKGSEIYCEGALKLSTYEAAGGEKRSSLNLSAWKAELIGAIGRKPQQQGQNPPMGQAPQRRRTPNNPYQGINNGTGYRQPNAAIADPDDALPF